MLNPVKLMDKTTGDYLPRGSKLFEGDSTSRRGLNVPGLIFAYGDRKTHIRKFPRIVRWLLRAVASRSYSYRSLKKNPAVPNTTADSGLLAEIEDRARSWGCHAVGYTEVSPDLIFAGKSIAYPHAIVLTMPMDKNRIGRAPAIISGQEVWRVYDGMGIVVNKLARFLRRKGYGAQAGPALGGEVNYPRLAQAAGLGWIGTHGLLISPKTGPSQRIAVVYTSIENLPIPAANPHSWVEGFCSSCGKCVRVCPSGAIFAAKPVMPDGGPRHIDYRKCAVPFSETLGCSVCIKECVFFRGDYGKIRTAHRRKTGAPT